MLRETKETGAAEQPGEGEECWLHGWSLLRRTSNSSNSKGERKPTTVTVTTRTTTLIISRTT